MKMILMLWCLVSSGLLYVCNGQLVPALTRDPAEIPYLMGLGNSGWTFYAQVPLVVGAVGFYDHQGDGLFEEQEITIWKDTSGRTDWPFIDPVTAELVSSITVPRGTEAALVGSYRVFELGVELTLAPGGYQIACSSATGQDGGKLMNVVDPVDPGADPRILLGAPATGPGSPPGEYIAAYGAHVGPMMFIEVPEPSTPALLLLGSLALLTRQIGMAGGQRRRKSSF